MNYNIINEYTDYLKKAYLELFKIVFKNKYHKEEVSPFIERYINVRYYNETNYPTTRDFTKRINKELIDVVNKMANDDNIEQLKNYVALFAYLIYFDDINYVVEEMELINSIVDDDIVKISDKESLRNEIRDWYIKHVEAKDTFNSAIDSNCFGLLEKRLYRKLFNIELEYNIKISNLYSEYAIDRAYNTGIVNEDKAFVTFILASGLILKNAINLDFSKRYAVVFPQTLLSKEKKRNRLIKVFDNILAKKHIVIKIKYADYTANKKIINEYINDGYTFGIELDSTFTGNITELFLFPFILVYNGSEEYEMLLRGKERLKSTIIKL